MKTIFLCAISNVVSGTCVEDCGFCTQSVKWKADIERYKEKPLDQVLEEAKRAKKAGAVGFCLVTAGKGLDDKTLDYICRASHLISSANLDLNLIACNGTASADQLTELKNAGIRSYNHNLETSEKFYPNICTTHDWQDRYATCEAVNSVGLKLVCGGIFGLGESDQDRFDLLNAIKSLNPKTVPLNFYIQNRALPIKTTPIDEKEGLLWVKNAREILGEKTRIMLAGGKEQVFGEDPSKAIEAGANALVVGNYLTTQGMDSDKLYKTLVANGYKIADSNSCKE